MYLVTFSPLPQCACGDLPFLRTVQTLFLSPLHRVLYAGLRTFRGRVDGQPGKIYTISLVLSYKPYLQRGIAFTSRLSVLLHII
jgi:hypothetical protein